jgi:hypothetical protein
MGYFLVFWNFKIKQIMETKQIKARKLCLKKNVIVLLDEKIQTQAAAYSVATCGYSRSRPTCGGTTID